MGGHADVTDAGAVITDKVPHIPGVPPSLETGNSQNRQALRNLESDAAAGVLTIGTVIRAVPGVNWLEVSSDISSSASCTYAPAMFAGAFGIRSTYLPPEGSSVIVLFIPGQGGRGIVLGTVPPVCDNIASDSIPEGTPAYVLNYGGESAGGVRDQRSYREVYNDRDNDRTLDSSGNRAEDILPGEQLDMTDAGAFRALLQYMAAIGGGHRSKIECFVFDDLIRMTTGRFQHYHCMGSSDLYNDEGYASSELAGSWFTPENYGQDDYTPALKSAPEQADGAHSQIQTVDGKLRDMKRRYQLYTGTLGDFTSLFLCNPADGNTAEQGATGPWPGMLRATVGGNGRIDIRSASGFSFERSDRIPVPRRSRTPDDPAGSSPAGNAVSTDDDLHKAKKAVQLPDDHKIARNVVRADLNAALEAEAYRRFDELLDDFSTPEAADTPVPPDEYDPLKSTENFSENTGKRCGWSFDPDGSFHIWGAGGCELFGRSDGTMIIGAPKGIMLQSGGELVTLARSTVIKSRDSLDLVSTDEDVRISARGNMHLYTKDKGILLETDSTSTGHGFTADASGTAVNSRGITFKAAEATVGTYARQVLLKSSGDVIIHAVKGTLRMVAATLSGIFKILSMGSKGAGLKVSGTFARVFGSTAILAGSRAAGVYAGSKVHIPYKLEDAPDQASQPIESAGTDFSSYYDNDSWLGDYRESSIDCIKFTYRSPEEYRTEKSRLYQTLWQLAAAGSSARWSEDPVNSTYPWPGKDVRDTVYCTVSGLINVDSDTGLPKARSEIRANETLAAFAGGTLDNYIYEGNTNS